MCFLKKLKNPLKNKKRETTLILVSIMILVLFFSGYSMGKEHSNVNVETNAKIAEPILIVENNPILEMDGKEKIGYYDFKVKNHKETGEITEVDLNYNIEIIAPIEKTISFKLYQENEEIPLQNNKTKDFTLEKEKVQEHNYRLEIVYDKTQSDSIEDIIQEVQIKVHSQQLGT